MKGGKEIEFIGSKTHRPSSYDNVKAINGKDGMECFFLCINYINDQSSMTDQCNQRLQKAGYMLWPNRPLGLFADFTVRTFLLPYYPILFSPVYNWSIV